MKPILLTAIAIILLAQAGTGQGITLYATPTVKYDTVKCWFKELVVGKFSNADNGFIKCNESDPGATIFETWYKGYQVLQEHSPTETTLAIYSQTPLNTHVCYLYSDRKTKVTNQVIFSIERK